MKAILKIWNGTSLIVKILIGLVLGALFGLLMPQAGFLTVLGDLFVGALKGIAPLLVLYWSSVLWPMPPAASANVLRL